MKILHVKINGVLNRPDFEVMKERIKEELNSGLLITDKSFETEVLEVDLEKVERVHRSKSGDDI